MDDLTINVSVNQYVDMKNKLIQQNKLLIHLQDEKKKLVQMMIELEKENLELKQKLK